MHNNFDVYEKQNEEYGIAESDKCYWQCWCADVCDPYAQLTEGATLKGSLWALFGIYVGCYLTAWMILTCLSSKYE